MNMMTQIFLVSSLILNSCLLIYLFGLIPFLLFISLMLNVGFVCYLSYLLNERTELRNDFGDLLTKFEMYASKLVQLYELEMFYGDEVLEDLLNSSRILINNFYEYENKYFISENDDDIEEEGKDINDTAEEGKDINDTAEEENS